MALEFQFGAVFPTTAIGSDPGAIRAFAVTAEELGYRDLLFYDHIVLPWEKKGKMDVWQHITVKGTGDYEGNFYSEDLDIHEPLTTMAFCAAVTSTIQLTTCVMIAPMRQTALMAKQIAEVGVLSSGRITVGLGVGWNPVEFDAMGMSLDHRGDRIEEQIKLMRIMLKEPYIEFSGKYHNIPSCSMNPKPPRPVPFWMGGTAIPGYKRAGRIADGFIFHGAPSRPDVQEGVACVNESLKNNGRDNANFGYQCMVDFSVGPAEWQAEMELWHKLGGTHFAMRSMDHSAEYYGLPRNNFTKPQQYIDALGIFAREVGVSS